MQFSFFFKNHFFRFENNLPFAIRYRHRVTETVAAKPAPKKPSASDLFPPKPAEPQSSAAPSLRPSPRWAKNLFFFCFLLFIVFLFHSPSLPPAGPPPRANGKPSGGVAGILEKLSAKKKMSVLVSFQHCLFLFLNHFDHWRSLQLLTGGQAALVFLFGLAAELQENRFLKVQNFESDNFEHILAGRKVLSVLEV